MFMPPGCRVRRVNIRRPSTRRLASFHGITEACSCHGHHHGSCCVSGKAEMFSYGQVRFLCDGAQQMFTEPVPEPASSFINVRHSACTTSNNVNEVTGRTRESLSDGQRSTRGFDLELCVCVGRRSSVYR